jgi:hypothetical protein
VPDHDARFVPPVKLSCSPSGAISSASPRPSRTLAPFEPDAARNSSRRRWGLVGVRAGRIGESLLAKFPLIRSTTAITAL